MPILKWQSELQPGSLRARKGLADWSLNFAWRFVSLNGFAKLVHIYFGIPDLSEEMIL